MIVLYSDVRNSSFNHCSKIEVFMLFDMISIYLQNNRGYCWYNFYRYSVIDYKYLRWEEYK